MKINISFDRAYIKRILYYMSITKRRKQYNVRKCLQKEKLLCMLIVKVKGDLMKKKTSRFETKAIHGGYEPNQHFDSLTPPIYQTSTFTFSSLDQGAYRFSGEEEGFIYSRISNPTVDALEKRVAELEGGEKALAFSSGMAAVSAALIGLTKKEDHILCSKGVYGCTFGLLQLLKEKYNIEHTFSYLDTSEEIISNIRSNTTCIYIETPINPTMRLIDLEKVASIAKERGIKVIVDNTFSTPYLQQPLKKAVTLLFIVRLSLLEDMEMS